MIPQCDFKKIRDKTYKCRQCGFVATRIKYLPIWRDCTGKTGRFYFAPGYVLEGIIYWAYPEANAKLSVLAKPAR